MKPWIYYAFTTAYLMSASNSAYASLFEKNFKNEDGSTKWQHVANFSSGVLITLLTIAIIFLYLSHRKAKKANNELKKIKSNLEIRVADRTETLNESNRKLAESNRALEGEINQHKTTSLRLEQSEAYMSNVLQSMPSMLIGLDVDLNVTQWNKTAEEITGVSYDKALGKNLWEVYPTITISDHDAKKVIATSESLSIKHSQRGQYYFDITIYPLQDSDSNGVVIQVENITQRTLAENMLIQKDKMSSMGELAATVAHDINTPLQAMLHDIQKVRETIKKEDGAYSQLNDALLRGRQTAAIIKNLMELSRTHGDKKDYANIPKLFNDALKLAHSVLNEPSGIRFEEIHIVKDVEKNLPDMLCYPSELKQAFFNLIRHCYINLFDLSRDNWTPEIKIEVSENYDAVWIKIQHNGQGLSIEEQQEIFEPFFTGIDPLEFNQPKTSVENRLSFSHFIISDHHQGQVAITSAPEIGTTFHIQLPLKSKQA